MGFINQLTSLGGTTLYSHFVTVCGSPSQDVGVAGVPDATPSGTPSLGLSEEVAALVKAARAKEWRPDPKAGWGGISYIITGWWFGTCFFSP